MEIITAKWQFDTKTDWKLGIGKILLTIFRQSSRNIKLILLVKIVALLKEIQVIKEFGVLSPHLGD